MEHFTPLTATIGGILIGLAATLLWVGIGRTAGISSIAGGIIPVHRGEVLWRLCFLIGLPLGAIAGTWAGPRLFAELSGALPRLDIGAPALVVAGLLAGIGTRVGGGCTSGHGICGLARFSTRSLVAVATFMVTAMITVFIMRHVAS